MQFKRKDPLHRQDIVTLHTDPLPAFIKDRYGGSEVLVTGPDNARLAKFLPLESADHWFTDSEFAIPPEAAVHIGNQHTLPYADGAFETVIQLLPPVNGYQRAPIFHEAMRVCEQGGIIATATGLRTNDERDHDASYWIPHTSDGELSAIHVFRAANFNTPRVLSEFEKESQ